MYSISINLYYYYHCKGYLLTIIWRKCRLSSVLGPLFLVSPRMSPYLVYFLIMGDQTYNNVLKKDTYGIMGGVLTR